MICVDGKQSVVNRDSNSTDTTNRKVSSKENRDPSSGEGEGKNTSQDFEDSGEQDRIQESKSEESDHEESKSKTHSKQLVYVMLNASLYAHFMTMVF